MHMMMQNKMKVKQIFTWSLWSSDVSRWCLPLPLYLPFQTFHLWAQGFVGNLGTLLTSCLLAKMECPIQSQAVFHLRDVPDGEKKQHKLQIDYHRITSEHLCITIT